MNLLEIYEKLLKEYGNQNWWPVSEKSEDRRFEIITGAILTQNTSWKNVEKAIQNLNKENTIDAQKILETSNEKLAQLIKPAGYYNQKAKKLKEISRFYLSLDNKIPAREQLLNTWGVGKETADSILLYAYEQPVFVIDAYTKRMFSCLSNKNTKEYDELQDFFHKNLPRDTQLFNEFHALIVKHCKDVCIKSKKHCKKCFLKNQNTS